MHGRALRPPPVFITSETMVTVKINNKEVNVEEGTLILDAAAEAGYEIPTFCYHKELLGVGSCRMCLVEVEGQRKLQPACITPVIEGMSVQTETETLKSSRAAMLEFLLSNHALDCPVCDKGGECELQDMVRKHGPRVGVHAETRNRFHDKDYNLNAVIVKNSNRCVQCTRCVRVCSEVVGRGVLGAVGRGVDQEETSFLRGYLDCDHDGMCIEVCPVGCFMRRPYRYSARPWDLTGVRTVCPYCAAGCTMNVEARDGVVLRSVARVGEGINEQMLCARGRFGYDLPNNAERLTAPLVKKNGEFVVTPWDDVLLLVNTKLRQFKGATTGAVASARLTNEELFRFQQFVRGVLKSPNVDSASRWDSRAAAAFVDAVGVPDGGTALSACLGADTVLVVGCQLSDENPVTEYMTRRAAATKGSDIIIASPRAMKLDSSASMTLRHMPGALGPLFDALSAVIYEKNKGKLSKAKGAKRVAGLKVDKLAVASGLTSEELAEAAEKLARSSSVSILVGTDLMRYGEGASSLALLGDTLRALGIKLLVLPLLDRANQRGAWDMGVHPDFGPGYTEVKQGLGCHAMLEAALKGEIEAMYIVGEDVIGLSPDQGFAKEALTKLKFLVVQDSFMTETARMADVVLPASTFVEKEGTYTNQEGRVQRIRALQRPPGGARSDLDLIAEVACTIEPSFGSFDSAYVFDEIITNEVASYADIDLDKANGTGSLVGANKAGVKISSADTGPGVEDAGSRPFVLSTGNHLFHSGSLSPRSGILAGLLSDATIEISSADADARGLSDGDMVTVTGAHHSAEYKLVTRRGSNAGVAFIPEHLVDLPVGRFFKRGAAWPRVDIVKVG